ncbi:MULTISPECIES: flagellar export protein FliJ [Sutcliffiella]|uniref:Flagellar FliJ protein n=1 Tax=Sutcliffiella cohnii TaxID=33932 RepID=A0A223KRN8_9BACI|nr:MULTISPECIES: flagellar export protein FliJ [Sutcliffiella]AST92057.1 flagellar export protein FliJ [Sutcliffiella cohnii]MED4015339.1 flagellar export protein FliJ [Sutcliffiella cohnii]WBL13291.1 flagellar export protein FliJ [Sutcliffiella sp. NC1]
MNDKLYKLQNILKIKQSEKNVIHSEYKEAIEQFEKEGNQLYSLLKKKEDLEESIHNRISTGIKVEQLMQQQYFVTNLEKSLLIQQRKVSHARAFMNLKEEKLKEQAVECKKYEKLVQNYTSMIQEKAKKLDIQFLDELSILQFTHQPNR